MGYKIVYKKSIKHDLKKIDKKEAKRILDEIESKLILGPKAHPPLKGDFAGLRKFRVGDYRVIYVVVKQDVMILKIGNRKDVYK